MAWIGLFVGLLLPLGAAGSALVWFGWRGLALARSRTAEGEIVGWTPVRCEGAPGEPDFDRYSPVVAFRADDGVVRTLQLRIAYDAPSWPHPRPPTVHYVTRPWPIAAEGKAALLGPPVGLFAVALVFLAAGLALGLDAGDWRRLDSLARAVAALR
jgi:hypothetical protein